MFYHAYNGEFQLLTTTFVLNYTSGNQLMIIFLSAYMDNAFPADELMPLSCKVCMNSSRLKFRYSEKATNICPIFHL